MVNWKAGMKAVCIESHSMRATLVGVVYTVKGIDVCKCGAVGLDVGVAIKCPYTNTYCSGCETDRPLGTWWQSAYRFRPLLGDEQHELDAIEQEVKETELIPA